MSAAATPGRIPKGKKMPGHMGAEQVTVEPGRCLGRQ